MERVIKPVAIPARRIDKSVEVLFFIHWLKQQASDFRLAGVFDQDSGRAINSPHFESRPEESPIGKKLVQTSHGMKAIDGRSILSCEPVIGAIADRPAIEQSHAIDTKI